ncbi:ABC transporter substrate-binding protein [Erythrobacter dokdonensis]|uniref:Putative oligopeptide uptake ABC transporter periplasmic solute-binding protein n=1 Tax=Erythrobacter dokdonensis DSW-74 TaxID=1300349 RepID=A0A1A7BEW3_9SPHN|nr:ABC transporter substrate-binding protein [Erythrobacter dokdonensis]OBV09927.1 putative oligopeptide uptake ABC transporter periplasmic solute-binding protein [Erythrobacter dokdonensis DSW-74]
MRIRLTLFLALLLAACGSSAGGGPVKVAIIGAPESLFQQGVRLSPAAQHLRAATFEGLVTLDPGGQVVPALAERWIVTDDGLSYIFRLRDGTWPDGEEISAADVRRLLRESLRRLRGTSLGLDLAKIEEIRAMTGRVVEVRLSAPMPDFLRLLAQPEVGFVKSGSGAGPMAMSRDEDTMRVRLSALPPETRGLPAREDWEELARPVQLQAQSAAQAVAAFKRGDVDLVLGGSIVDFPQAEAGPLSRGTIQVDPTLGLLGLVVREETGLLGDPARREALSMAIDRTAVIQPFGLGGWQANTWIVPQGAFSQPPYPAQRWADLSLQQRRATAAARIRAWETQSGKKAQVAVGLPAGPGSDLLFRQLAEAWSEIGVVATRKAPGEGAELELRDSLARYSSPRWYLNQFNCSLKAGLCSPEADALVRASLAAGDPAERERLLAEAHGALIAREAYIPLGAPVRWSLVRGSLNNYLANQWGLHPLFPLSQPTT